jgi:anti-sigma B factor antagonist
MNIYENWQAKTLLLSLEGRLDTITAPLLLQKFNEYVDRVDGLSLDLSKVSYISSLGIRALFTIMKTLHASNNKFIITGVSEPVKEIFETTGMINLFVRDERHLILRDEKVGDKLILTLAGSFDQKALLSLKAEISQAQQEGRGEVHLIVKDSASKDKRLMGEIKNMTKELAEASPPLAITMEEVV